MLVEFNIIARDKTVTTLVRFGVSIHAIGDGFVVFLQSLVLCVGLRGEVLKMRDSRAVQHRANKQSNVFFVRSHDFPLW